MDMDTDVEIRILVVISILISIRTWGTDISINGITNTPGLGTSTKFFPFSFLLRLLNTFGVSSFVRVSDRQIDR